MAEEQPQQRSRVGAVRRGRRDPEVPRKDVADALDPEALFQPHEVAKMFGVRVETVTQWARDGVLRAKRTVGGHRRYRWADVAPLLAKFAEAEGERQEMVADAVRLYDQGWNIWQVAKEFGFSYQGMHRILKRNTTLRSRNGVQRKTD